MPSYNLPLLLRIEPLILELKTENDVPILPGSIKDPKKKIFIYKPVDKSNPERNVIWYCGETHYIRVFTKYPLLVPIIFNNVSVITQGIKAISYVTRVVIKDTPIFDVKVKPMEVGTLSICGIVLGFGNISCNHYVKPNGVGIYASKYERKYKDTVCNINVVEGIPKIAIHIESTNILNGCL